MLVLNLKKRAHYEVIYWSFWKSRAYFPQPGFLVDPVSLLGHQTVYSDVDEGRDTKCDPTVRIKRAFRVFGPIPHNKI